MISYVWPGEGILAAGRRRGGFEPPVILLLAQRQGVRSCHLQALQEKVGTPPPPQPPVLVFFMFYMTVSMNAQRKISMANNSLQKVEDENLLLWLLRIRENPRLVLAAQSRKAWMQSCEAR
jgi:hypothetical protein